jgi:hypothetical protein
MVSATGIVRVPDNLVKSETTWMDCLRDGSRAGGRATQYSLISVAPVHDPAAQASLDRDSTASVFSAKME